MYISEYDQYVIGFCLLFLIAIGLAFRRFIGNISDYFRGGGQMHWWLTGASAFMVQFSAWTFTGAAGKTYQDGPIILALFFANAVGFFINYLYFAGKFRQMLVITPIEGIRDRFGHVNEQFFTWLRLIVGTLSAGIWLNAVSIFMGFCVVGCALYFSKLKGLGLFDLMFNSGP